MGEDETLLLGVNPAALAPEMSQLASLKAVSRVLTKNLLGSNSFID